MDTFEIHSLIFVSLAFECASDTHTKKKKRQTNNAAALNSWNECLTVKCISSSSETGYIFVECLQHNQTRYKENKQTDTKNEMKIPTETKNTSNRKVFLHAHHTIRIRIRIRHCHRASRECQRKKVVTVVFIFASMYCVYLVWENSVQKDMPHERRDIADGYLS